MPYTKLTDFAAKDALLTLNPAKLIKGVEIGAELDAIAADSAAVRAIANGGTGGSTKAAAAAALEVVPVAGGSMTGGLAVGTTSGVLQFPDGAVGAPGLRVGSSSTTGLFSSGDNTIRVAVSGVQVAIFDSNGMQGNKAPTVQVFTSSGTYTAPAGLKAAEIYVKGGGGSGGGSSSAGRGGGGGEGEEAWKMATAATIGASQTVTIGAAAAGIALNTNSAGNTGVTTSFGAIVTAVGGAGGASGNNGGAGGTGGTGGTGEDYAMPGSAGHFGADPATGTAATSGTGGGKGGGLVNVAGIANSGGGGGGGTIAAGSGDGGTGIVIVREYY